MILIPTRADQHLWFKFPPAARPDIDMLPVPDSLHKKKAPRSSPKALCFHSCAAMSTACASSVCHAPTQSQSISGVLLMTNTTMAVVTKAKGIRDATGPVGAGWEEHAVGWPGVCPRQAIQGLRIKKNRARVEAGDDSIGETTAAYANRFPSAIAR